MTDELLRWYKRHGRDLPWRKTKDPYRILVSEIMLQQTQVQRGLLYYDKWFIEFPDWATLAKASNAAVITAWAGLGYNRRALALRNIARQVIEQGEPKTRDEWLAFKGIGPYTSAALAVFTLGEKVLPVDTNIRRILGRYFLGKFYPQLDDDAAIVSIASKPLFRSSKYQDVPQALFDLATMHCTKVPDCSACPLRKKCKSAPDFLAGKVEPPKRMTKKSNENIREGKKYPDRIYRGRILKAVRENGKLKQAAIGEIIDKNYTPHDKDWVNDMIERLIKDQLLAKTKNNLHLPK